MHNARGWGLVAAALLLPVAACDGEPPPQAAAKQPAQQRTIGDARRTDDGKGRDGQAPASSCPRRDALPPVVHSVETQEPVVYVTLDDGFHRDPEILDDLRGLHPTLFIMGGAIRKEPSYWRRAKELGYRFENHTMFHANLATSSPADQLAEILAGSAAQASVVGTMPTVMRPPFGSWSEVTRQVVAEAGLRALVMWSVEIENGRPKTKRKLVRGDIILLHFTRHTRAEIALVRRMMAEAGLRPAPLPACLS